MSNNIAVIDYGMGNLHSVASALSHVAPEATVTVTGDAAAIAAADRVVFPGVGAIRDCMAEILNRGVKEAVADTVQAGKPLLAVCVGLQALMDASDENNGVTCLGHFAGQVKAFSGYQAFAEAQDPASGERLKVPHMGWNQVSQTLRHPLWEGIADNSRFYFVHSYCVQAADPAVIAGTCRYGVEFSAALARDNLFAAQFHPEKSADCGLQLLRNFVRWDGCC